MRADEDLGESASIPPAKEAQPVQKVECVEEETLEGGDVEEQHGGGQVG